MTTYLKGLVIALGLLTSLQAQQIYTGPSTAVDPKWATLLDFDGQTVFCRGWYTSVREEPEGIGWWTDYPGADYNFIVRLAEFTTARASTHVVIKLTDPYLFLCPVLYMSDTGTLGFTDPEVVALQAYFAKGGFLWVDDFWGTEAWDHWTAQLKRVLPTAYWEEVPANHPLLHQQYDLPEIWQQPHAEFWYATKHQTSERGNDSPQAHFRMWRNDEGRILAVATHNTDIADGWEKQDVEYSEYFLEFTSKAYALGINIFLYAMTH